MEDASLKFNFIDIDAKVNDEDYIINLRDNLQHILDHRFPNNKGKRNIKSYKDRISFACPVCGDSMQSDYKKRGNFILQGKFRGYFKCHNCGAFMRIDNFFKEYQINLDLNILNYITDSINDFSNIESKGDMSVFLDLDKIEKYAIDRQEFSKVFGLIEVKESSVWSWLRNRLQYDASKFLYNNKENYLVILNLTPTGKILGIQKRLFFGHNRYLTYTLSKLYGLMKKDPKLITDELDSVSQLFNICLLDYTRPVTLFEGPLDSFLFKNSIANAGIHKHFPFELLMRYWFDDDKDGRNESIKRLNDGHEVFLWTKLKQDYNMPLKQKWDLNDALIWFNKNNIKPPNFNLYFSNKPIDIIDI